MNLTDAPRKSPLCNFLPILLLLLFFAFPQACGKGAKNGLLLWFEEVLPSLLPTMILSGLCMKLGIIRYLATFLAPIGRLLFGVSPYGCYPVFLGFLTGMPTGAAAVSELVESGAIDRKEGNYLLCFCNNMSPMFLMQFAAAKELKLPQFGLPLCFIIWGSSLISARFISLFFGKAEKNSSVLLQNTLHTTEFQTPETSAFQVSETSVFPKTLPKFVVTDRSQTEPASRSFSISVDEAIMDSFGVLIKVGGYIILFSVLAEIILHLFGISLFSGIVIGFLEVTTGIRTVAGLSPLLSVPLVCAFTAFGGISGSAQTVSIVKKSRLHVTCYLLSKLLSAILAAGMGAAYVQWVLFFNQGRLR